MSGNDLVQKGQKQTPLTMSFRHATVLWAKQEQERRHCGPQSTVNELEGKIVSCVELELHLHGTEYGEVLDKHLRANTAEKHFRVGLPSTVAPNTSPGPEAAFLDPRNR